MHAMVSIPPRRTPSGAFLYAFDRNPLVHVTDQQMRGPAFVERPDIFAEEVIKVIDYTEGSDRGDAEGKPRSQHGQAYPLAKLLSGLNRIGEVGVSCHKDSLIELIGTSSHCHI